MGLLDDMVEVFNLVHNDRHGAANVDRIDHHLVGDAFIQRDFIRIAIRPHSLSKNHVTLRRHQEVRGLGLLVDSAVEIWPRSAQARVLSAA